MGCRPTYALTSKRGLPAFTQPINPPLAHQSTRLNLVCCRFREHRYSVKSSSAGQALKNMGSHHAQSRGWNDKNEVTTLYLESNQARSLSSLRTRFELELHMNIKTSPEYPRCPSSLHRSAALSAFAAVEVDSRPQQDPTLQTHS